MAAIAMWAVQVAAVVAVGIHPRHHARVGAPQLLDTAAALQAVVPCTICVCCRCPVRFLPADIPWWSGSSRT
ncbi:hypothetical protein [Streptomyces sp. NPDC001480]|uniref:hypothetical protein n=1 Tax=Streptomyces sp. NPDC001480 TaxID=3364577 RepID=UPI003699264D